MAETRTFVARLAPSVVALALALFPLISLGESSNASLQGASPGEKNRAQFTVPDSNAEPAQQSVTRISSADQITIEVKNGTEQLAMAQNTAAPADSADDAAAIFAAEQKGLFRIYRSNLLKKTYQHVIYPESAIDRNQQGDVVLKVLISRSGKVKSIVYDKRAEFNSLNKAATKAVYNAKPFPPAPSRLEGETFEVVMPIRFRLAG